MSEQESQCEVSRSAGFDPTGEWAVECGAPGEYCEKCEMVVCAYCHETITHQRPHRSKKPPAGISHDEVKRRAG